MLKFFTKLLDLNEKEISKLRKVVDKINSLEDKVRKLKDKEFPKETQNLRKNVKDGEILENILPYAFALVREASRRALGKRHYDVQLMAAVALFQGKVVEQKTGEGKTLSAVPALYLRSLTGKSVHLVTVNDYLARLGAGWNGPIFEFLGLSVGVVIQENKSFIYDKSYSDYSHGDERLSHLRPVSRKEAYQADVTYGTNNEFGFDYLRDNMVNSLDQVVQRDHYFAIVDEVDSVLIDEARTPLIISAPDTDPTDKYYKFAELVEKLNPDTDFKVDEKYKTATLTEHGITRVEKILGVDNLYESDYEAIHHIENALRAKTLFLRNRDYVVKDNSIIIVDEFTGRLMVGRRWSDGLHQAIEAKEKVPIQQESKTLATISFQNYFRLYEVLSGMTGTAATEAEEFKKIYKLDVVVIPTHKQMIRKDMPDVIYKTVRAKYSAIVDEVEKRRSKGQPVLIGTTSIEKNEILGSLLRRKKIPHNILNAKNHEKEALVIADAGKPGAVTVATNMAGRGVDIILGGVIPDKPEGMSQEQFEKSQVYKNWKAEHDKVVKAGGLHVIGTERHESRRIDNQLRGRAGRQGDPGSSQFFLSLEDDLLRIFGGDQIKSIMDKLKIGENESIENSLISRVIEQAQIKVEGFHFDSRKHVVEYDDVINRQRDFVYKLRRKVLESEDLSNEIQEKLDSQIDKIALISTLENGFIDVETLVNRFVEIVPFDDPSRKRMKKEVEKRLQDIDLVKDLLKKAVRDVIDARKKEVGESVFKQICKVSYLSSIDKLWIEHIDTLDDLRNSVRLRAYGQKDPLVEFKNEAYMLFENLLENIDYELSLRLFRIQALQIPFEPPLGDAKTNFDNNDNTGLIDATADYVAKQGMPVFETKEQKILDKALSDSRLGDAGKKQSISKAKIGRNDPCWCGSGKKWKFCHYPQKS
ncbi:MAG: preprotein translocase subunit SecA [Patescibacteria group bacterium]|nr:preprotein translocase subunit SecA [Patescibacteria group bacterium]